MENMSLKIKHLSDLCRQEQDRIGNCCQVSGLLLNALEVTPLGLWSWDVSTNQVVLSSEIFEISGADPKLFDGKLDYVIENIIHPSHRGFFKEAIETDLSNGVAQIREFRIQNPTKEVCWVRLSGKLVLDENNNPVEYVGTVLDITSDHLAHTQLKNDLGFFEALIDALPNPIYYKDCFGLYRYCNTAFLKYLGLSREQVIDKGVYDIASKELADIYHKADHDLMETQGTQVYEANVRYSDGTLHDVIFSKAAHLDSRHQTIGLVGIMQDITDKKRMEHQVKMHHQIKDAFLEINHVIMSFENEKDLLEALLVKLQVIFEPCHQSSVLEVTDQQSLRVVASNGFDKEEIHDFIIPLTESFIWNDVQGALNQAHIVNDIENYVNKNGAKVVSAESGESIKSTVAVPIMINDKLKWIFSFDSHINHVYTELHRDVADFIREELPLLYRIYDLNHKNLQLSRYDGLTQLMTRSYFDSVFEDRLQLSRRHDFELLVVLFDLDGLKKINDSHGHLAGDRYITTFTSMLLEYYRKSDMFARIGGDEFVGLFSNTSFEVLSHKIAHMRGSFEKILIQSDQIQFSGSFSYGIARFPVDSDEKSKLLQIADFNMYRDKSRDK